VLFPPDDVKVIADAKIAADLKAAIDAGNAAVAQAKAEAEVKAKEAAVIKAKAGAEVKAKEVVKAKASKAAAHEELERTVAVAVQRRIEANTIRSKLEKQDSDHFRETSFQKHLHNCGERGVSSKRLSELKQVLPRLRAECDEAQATCAQLEATCALAQRELNSAKAISDHATSKFSEIESAADRAQAALQTAEKNLASCKLAEDHFCRAAVNRKRIGIAALFVITAAIISRVLHIFDFDSFSLPANIAASAVFVTAVYFAVWGLVSSFRTTEDTSGLQNRRVAAAGVVSKAARVLEAAQSKRRVEYKALELAREKTKAANEVVAKINISLDKESKIRDSKQKSLVDGVAEEKQLQRAFDGEEAIFNKVFSENRQKQRATAQHADESAAEAYKIAAAAWSSVETMDDFGTKREREPETQPTFEIFFKQKMMEEEQRLKEKKEEEGEDDSFSLFGDSPKSPTHSPSIPAPAARSSSPGPGWKLLGALAAPYIEGFRRKNWPTEEEKKKDAHDKMYPMPND
jgi:hypothetical protein